MLEYKVTYSLSVRSSEAPGESGDVILYHKPPRLRIDTTIRAQRKTTGKSSLYFFDDDVYECDIKDVQKPCIKTSKGKLDSLAYKAVDIALGVAARPQEYASTYLGTDLLTGTFAHCWEVTPQEGKSKETLDLCASPDGVPRSITYYQQRGNRVQLRAQLRAQSVVRQVAPEEFKVPQ